MSRAAARGGNRRSQVHPRMGCVARAGAAPPSV